jgi:hypothetical protein
MSNADLSSVVNKLNNIANKVNNAVNEAKNAANVGFKRGSSKKVPT